MTVLKKKEYAECWARKGDESCLEQARLNGMSYSAFIGGLKSKRIELDRKILADLAVHNPEAFAELVTSVNE